MSLLLGAPSVVSRAYCGVSLSGVAFADGCVGGNRGSGVTRAASRSGSTGLGCDTQLRLHRTLMLAGLAI